MQGRASRKHRAVDNGKCAIVRGMDTREAGRMGALKTNKILTSEMRKKAAKKGWKLRKQRIANIEKGFEESYNRALG